MQSERTCGEAELVARAQQGDRQAMETLLALHQMLIASLARRLWCFDGLTREELVQAGNLGFMQAVYRYDARKQVKLITYAVPWVLGEMRRAMRSAEKRCVSLEEERGEEGASLLETLRGSAGVNVEHIDLRMAMQRLPKEEQTLICLRYFRDRTQKEAAELLHKSQTQISRMERRALDQLHAWLM